MTDTPTLADRIDAECPFTMMSKHLPCDWPGHALADEVRELERVVAEYRHAPSYFKTAEERIAALERENEGLRAALTTVRACVGGDDPAGGMDAPEDVWNIADSALRGGKQ